MPGPGNIASLGMARKSFQEFLGWDLVFAEINNKMLSASV